MKLKHLIDAKCSGFKMVKHSKLLPICSKVVLKIMNSLPGFFVWDDNCIFLPYYLKVICHLSDLDKVRFCSEVDAFSKTNI